MLLISPPPRGPSELYPLTHGWVHIKYWNLRTGYTPDTLYEVHIHLHKQWLLLLEGGGGLGLSRTTRYRPGRRIYMGPTQRPE